MIQHRKSRWLTLLMLAVPVMTYSIDPTSAPGGKPDAPQAAHTVRTEDYFPQITENGNGGRREIGMTVGMIDERHRAIRIAPGQSAAATVPAFRPGDFLVLRFVIADDLEGHRYDIETCLDGEIIQKRSGETRGFGRRTVFVPLLSPTSPSGGASTNGTAPVTPVPSHTLTVVNRGAEALYMERADLCPDFSTWLAKPLASDDFTLALLVGEGNAPDRMDRVARLIDAPTVKRAIASEIYYMCRSDDDLIGIARATREVCEKYGLSFLAATCSWWAGTPPIVRERLDFQQICWSDTDTHDEGEPLRKLLGDKWDIRYGLTIPNKWSNTPWQTMNSAELNAMRRERMERAVAILEKEMPGRMAGYVSENEPAYWAFEESDEKYPVRRHPLWADFNPANVGDAKRDGVILDPSDGLDIIERVWLHYNVARYNEANIAAIHKAEPSGTVYSHALLDYNHFPLHGTGHARPYAEAARVTNAHLGVEMIWGTDMDALWRIREWGPWGCVNREECDGFDIRYHIATLRACYILGADLLNSYNWNGMTREGDPVEYFNTFLKEVAGDARVVVAERTGGEEWISAKQWSGPLEKNAAFPWFNTIELALKPGDMSGTLVAWITKGKNGDVVAYRRIAPGEASRDGWTRIDFGDLAQLRQDDVVALHLHTDGDWSIRAAGTAPDYRLLCDMRPERRRSQFVVGTAAGGQVESISLPLFRTPAP